MNSVSGSTAAQNVNATRVSGSTTQNTNNLLKTAIGYLSRIDATLQTQMKLQIQTINMQARLYRQGRINADGGSGSGGSYYDKEQQSWRKRAAVAGALGLLGVGAAAVSNFGSLGKAIEDMPSVWDVAGVDVMGIKHRKLKGWWAKNLRDPDATTATPKQQAVSVAVPTVTQAPISKSARDRAASFAGKLTPTVKNAILSAAAAIGVDPAMLLAVSAQEAGFDPNSNKGGKGAHGLFQFESGTWKGMVQTYGKKYGIGMGDVFDPAKNAIMGALYMKENQRGLAKAHHASGSTETYIAHFLGLEGAKKFLTFYEQQPDDIAAKYYPSSYTQSTKNGNIFYKNFMVHGKKNLSQPRTFREMYDVMTSKAGTGTVSAFGAQYVPGYKSQAPAPASPIPSISSPSSTSSSASVGVQYKVSQRFGHLRTIKGGSHAAKVHGGDYRHQGIDLVMPKGTPVYAARAGTVISVQPNSGSGGNVVIIKHKDGRYSCYMHLSEFNCHEGDNVSEGQQIAKSGDSGDAKGHPHLHYEVRTARKGHAIDPQTSGMMYNTKSTSSSQATPVTKPATTSTATESAVSSAIQSSQATSSQSSNAKPTILSTTSNGDIPPNHFAKSRIDAISPNRAQTSFNLNRASQLRALSPRSQVSSTMQTPSTSGVMAHPAGKSGQDRPVTVPSPSAPISGDEYKVYFNAA